MTGATAPKLVVPAHLHERQTTASDPAKSIWVSANAGSGKTHVLTQRVIRLLLGGVAPSKILCLTFTKAAATQMATRVFETLSEWTRLDDGALRVAILATGAPSPDTNALLLARRLFTRTVETPGGLKIQTIHAFCERLLHLFPFEANVPARFEVADERRTQEMLSLAKRAAVAATQGSAALALVADIAGSSSVDALIAQTMKLRAATHGLQPDPQAGLAARLGDAAATSTAAVRSAMLDDGPSPHQLSTFADIYERGSANDQKNALRLRQTLALRATDRVEALGIYLQIFFGANLDKTPRLATNAIAAANPDLVMALTAERERLEPLRARLKIAETVERTDALIGLVDAVLERYHKAKVAQGLLDFDDLIGRTLTLLERSDSGWVLHKLDAGIDHVLVDEAQDTSEAQWKILDRLTGDFAAGETSRDPRRSFFVVGDDKQSIFSFQGAAPLMFDKMRAQFQRRFLDGQKPFERVQLKTSFRSVPGILGAVDRVFDSALHQDGLVQPDDIWPIHESIKERLPGLVEIWPEVGATGIEDPADWSIPLDVPAEKDPVNIVADRVARKIKLLIAADSPDRVHDGRSETPRPIRPGDILVLVRTRGAFFEAVIRALKQHWVDVAGADRLDVANHIAVKDLVAAGRTALLPNDDLSLACLLKSPLFGLDDDDLIKLAPKRRAPLFKVLGASPDSRHRAAHTTIARWAARAVTTTPFGFYVELLGRDRGRFLMETRLGPEAHDAIDEFLRLALAHERQGAPSLGVFLADIEALESSIKRDMEGPGDAVRVMTVHAAKGLEAKIVFLPDTCAIPALQLDPNVFDLDDGRDQPPLLAWSPRKGDDPTVLASARAAERQATLREYRRLLYVALTRAEERLYIAGFYNKQKPPEDCWGAMIRRAFADAPDIPAFWDAEETIKRIASPGSVPPAALAKQRAREQRHLALLPSWMTEPVPTIKVARAPLRPSRLRRDGATAEMKLGLVYGSALHLLLQHLPDVAPDKRVDIGRAFLHERRATIPANMHGPLLAEAIDVLALPELTPLFGEGARSEVAVVGMVRLAGGSMRDVRGSIDRLVVTPDRVLIADFKTGSREDPPPPHYIEQMALYREVLAPLWAHRTIRALLVWTHDRAVIELAPDTLARALTSVSPSA